MIRIKSLCTWFVALFAVLNLASNSSAAPSLELDRLPGSKPRNIIFILADDHRYDAMGFMGHPFLETPNMDFLATNGVHA